MSPVTVTFIGVGCLALMLLALSLVGGHLHIVHFHPGHAGDSGPGLSLPVISGFVGAFGFGGAIAAELAHHNVLVAAAVGLLAAVPTAWATGRLMSAAMNMRTDATLTSGDLIGATGVIISAVPADGYGEVRLAVAGQFLKLNARAAQPLAPGTHVFVIEVPSPTSVLVEPTPHVL